MNRLFSLFDRKITIPANLIILVPLFNYLIWEIYWIARVGYPAIKWHTHLMAFAYIGFLIICLGRLLGRYISPPAIRNIFLAASSIFFSLLVAELILTIAGTNRTYMEQVSGSYVSMYQPLDTNYYHLWPTGKPHWLTKPEYSYWRPTNSLGFGDHEWTTQRMPGQKRILALGDSFTEGDGAPYDSSYVSILKQKLLTYGDSFYFMNAGVCGSDPFNNYIVLKDKLLDYHPDIIIQSLGSGDMDVDIMMRGGLERFQPDGTLKYRPAPWWEPIYALSYVSRIFFKSAGYSELVRKAGTEAAEKNRIDQSVKELFIQYAALCKKNGIRCIIVLHPQREEIEANKYNYNFNTVRSDLAALHIDVIDLLPCYTATIANAHGDAGDYFWKRDGHHNSKGYNMMAETTFESLKPILSDSAHYSLTRKIINTDKKHSAASK